MNGKLLMILLLNLPFPLIHRMASKDHIPDQVTGFKRRIKERKDIWQCLSVIN